MMKIPDSGRGLVRRLALAAGAILVLSAAFGERADALSLINPGAAHAAKQVSEGLATEVHGGHGGGGHGGGGHGGGGYHGGGFHGGGVSHRSCIPRRRLSAWRVRLPAPSPALLLWAGLL
jgi:hypothetical protein